MQRSSLMQAREPLCVIWSEMKVLHVLASGIGGGISHVRDLLCGTDSVIEQRLVIGEDSGWEVGDLRQRGFIVDVVNLLSWSWRSFWDLVSYIRDYSPDIVHCHGFRAGCYGRLAACVARMPWTPWKGKVVLTVHGFSYLQYGFFSRKCAVFFEKLLQCVTDRTIAVSRQDYRAICAHGMVRVHKARLVVNGIDPFEDLKGEEMMWNMPEDRGPVIGTIARLHPQKGLRYLIEAAATVLQKHAKACFLIVGDGPEYGQLLEYARVLEVEESMIFVGHQKRARKFLRYMDVFVLPSLWEGLPLSVLEAMCEKVPVIVTNVPGNAEIVVAGKTGMIVPPQNGSAIAHSIDSLLTDSKKANLLAENAWEVVHRDFTAERMRLDTLAVYREISRGK